MNLDDGFILGIYYLGDKYGKFGMNIWYSRQIFLIFELESGWDQYLFDYTRGGPEETSLYHTPTSEFPCSACWTNDDISNGNSAISDDNLIEMNMDN